MKTLFGCSMYSEQMPEKQRIDTRGRLEHCAVADSGELVILGERNEVANLLDMRGGDVFIARAPDQKRLALRLAQVAICGGVVPSASLLRKDRKRLLEARPAELVAQQAAYAPRPRRLTKDARRDQRPSSSPRTA